MDQIDVVKLKGLFHPAFLARWRQTKANQEPTRTRNAECLSTTPLQIGKRNAHTPISSLTSQRYNTFRKLANMINNIK